LGPAATNEGGSDVQRRRFGLFGGAATLVLASGMLLGGVQAQGIEAHPAHIHEGTCDNPGEVVIPLSDISADYLVDGTPSAGDMVGVETAVDVEASITTADVSLEEILEDEHVIMVHESAQDIETYIACGDIGGMLVGEETLPVGLIELNESGHSGIAWLTDNGDDTTTVSVALTDRSDEGMEVDATPVDDADAEATGDEASPVADAAEQQVMIEDFAYNPGTIEVSAGTTIVFTNMDSVPHTVTQKGGGDERFQSGKIDTGETFSLTLDEPGTYEYYCEFHPGMEGTIVVS
jgi:plastocyanin